MRYRDALKLHKGDEVIDKVSKESIYVICSFEEKIALGKMAAMPGEPFKQEARE